MYLDHLVINSNNCSVDRTFLPSLTSTLSHMLLQIMRSRRIERGALTLASAEVKFQIDTETHDPLDIGMLFEWQVNSPSPPNI